MSLININAVKAVWKRQLGSLLTNPLGYVFILAYVVVSGGFLFIPESFFQRNIADLGILVDIMPWLLVILLPAIAMGSWSTEKELGTDEQLLTLPLSEADALIGKWLAVISFFTLALVCSLSNIFVLLWLGNPDLGLVFANYAGWWFAGLLFAALSVIASVLVALPAIAFVLGALFCAVAMSFAQWGEWFDPFERGLLSVGNAAIALVMVVLALGIAVSVLSSRRWQKVQRPDIIVKAATFLAILVTAFNLSVQISRSGADIDVTEENLSSLSPVSRKILKGVEEPVMIAAFISEKLPPELALKGKEVENTLKVIDKHMGNNLELKLYRPDDPLDEAGSLATQHYGIQPTTVVVDTVTGREEQEIFLGVAVISGSRTQNIDHFDPGLSVEYELVRAIRTVGTPGKKVIGLVSTEFKMLGGFDYQTRQMRPDWQIVEEWRKQYEVREVNLDVPVGEDVDILVAPQPSGLTGEQIENLHDYIWKGRPALILEDPLPLFSGPHLGSSQPRQQSNPMAGQQQQQPPKGDLKPLLTALGLDMDMDQVLWSDYNPSHQFRKIWSRSLVWSFKSLGGIKDSAATTGIESLLFPWPGFTAINAAKNDELTVTPLVTPLESAPWGHHAFDEHFANTFFGMQKITPQRYIADAGPVPYIAVEITGNMKRAYPMPEDEREEADSPSDDKEGETSEEPGDGTGSLSEKPVHVILVADTDFAHDEFFYIYRNKNNQLSEDELRFVRDLRNVQFLANSVDALAGFDDFLELRTRRRRRRPLEVIEEVVISTQNKLRAAETSAQEEADNKIKKLRADFQERLDKIEGTEGLDENAKKQLKAQVSRSAQRRLDTDIEEINHQKNLKIREAKIEQQRAVENVRDRVRWLAIGLPALILVILALIVFINRKRGEQLIVPKSRQRSEA